MVIISLTLNLYFYLLLVIDQQIRKICNIVCMESIKFVIKNLYILYKCQTVKIGVTICLCCVQFLCMIFNRTISSWSEQTFNRAWNPCPRLRWKQWLKITGWGRSELTDRNVALYPQFFLELITTQLRFYMWGIIFSSWVYLKLDATPCWSWWY